MKPVKDMTELELIEAIELFLELEEHRPARPGGPS